MKKYLKKLNTPPILFLIISILSFGIMIPWLGFYGDDWSYIYFQHLLGSQGSGVFAAFDRPFSSWYYNLVVGLLGESPWGYHVYLLLLRWIGAVLLWKILKMIWPEKSDVLVWVSLLFLIYPGFMQQPISVEFILHYFAMDMFLLSVLGMYWAILHRKWFYPITLLSMICTGVLFSIEYFIGWEALRPFLLWLLIRKQEDKLKVQIKKTVLNWLPYLLVIGVFLAWRVFFFKFPTYSPVLLEHLAQNPRSAILELVKRILSDFKIVLLDAWRSTIHLPASKHRGLFLLVLLFSFAGMALFHYRNRAGENKLKEDAAQYVFKEWALHLIILGAISLLAAGWPFWITGISLELGFPWDRPALPFMLGVSMFTVGLVELLFREKFRFWILAVLISLSVGAHYLNAEIYREEWRAIKDLYWQLSWRAPALEPQTILASDDIPLYRVGDSAMSALLNWTYAPELHDAYLLYKIFDLHIRLDSDYAGLPAIEEGLPVEHNYRGTYFQSTTSNLVAFYYQKEQCLQVLYPYDDDYRLPEKVQRVLPLSKPELILDEREHPAEPPAFMNPEPEHTWCYYYAKAGLAKSEMDWQMIDQLWREAKNKGFEPNNSYELLPFIEGYLHLGEKETALEITDLTLQDSSIQPLICTTYQRVRTDLLAEEVDVEYIGELEVIFGCSE